MDVIVLDLDGVILEEGESWEDYSTRKPLPGIVDTVKRLSSRYILDIYTARRSTDSFWLTIQILKDYGLDKHVRRVVFDKPPGKFFVDDRSLTSLEELCSKIEL